MYLCIMDYSKLIVSCGKEELISILRINGYHIFIIGES